ncbi:hypothetical protein AALP_AA5G223800 [Arabis alpina]|uniref:Uncharacterized protein n=1 Tax=Arabis alpina TaxID=50452 RepID=A0A087GYR8_ARAAL|nr:hypothetical protein AALP_AA5G223800 [Arabis alpina]
MAKPENSKTCPEKQQTWSTWEELLLACAVHRHGTNSWDSVAVEIQKRNSTLHNTLTAFDCRHKYHNLKQRFSPESDDGETISEISSVPWLDELRKLRVDELRRELERYDLSISSLQSKVERLEEEREKSLKETIPDLDKIEPDPTRTGSENVNRDRKIIEPVNEEPNRIGEDSCRGSCESVEKESKEVNDSPEFIDESKETSDVQSSASLSRKETTIEQNQMDNVDQSLTVDKIFVESRPLIDFIEILQSHPIGSHFSRRLQNQLQETLEYEKIIKQHLDFEMIRTRVEEGYYGSSKSKFFRDLLLLINNVSVFYGEGTSEFVSAKQLNQLIKKEMMMSVKIPKQTSTLKEECLVTSKEEVTTVSSLKPKMPVPIIACRKRSSVAGRSSVSVNEPFKKKTKIVPTVDEKQVSEDEEEEEEEISDKDEEPIVSKKMVKGRTTSTAKKVESRNVKTSLNAGLSSKGRTSNDSSEQKKSDQEKKGNNANSGSKKQSVATFLKRMKGVSSTETVIETVKGDSSNGKRGVEQRKSNSKNDKVDAGKQLAGQKRSTGKKATTEKGSPAKKNTSTASKKGPAPFTPMVAKRGSEASEKEVGSSNRPKKRSRR